MGFAGLDLNICSSENFVFAIEFSMYCQCTVNPHFFVYHKALFQSFVKLTSQPVPKERMLHFFLCIYNINKHVLHKSD